MTGFESEVVAQRNWKISTTSLEKNWSGMLSGWLLTGFRKGVKTVCCSFLIGIELDSDENGRTEMQFKPPGFKLIAIQVSFLDRTLSHTCHIIYKFPVPVQCWLSFGNGVLSGVWWLTTLSASKARILCNLEQRTATSP